MSYTNPDGSIDSTASTDLSIARIQDGVIRFDAYESLKQRALEARDYLKALEITKDTEPECKRIVASARKVSDQLNQEKIRIKKEVMAPYMDFETKVKEIMAIVSEGEDTARDKLKELEDIRKSEKTAQISEIWEQRAPNFLAGKYFTFNDWLTDKHLNKTASMSAVEKEMVDFLVTSSSALKYLLTLPLGDEYAAEYVQTRQVETAIERVDVRHKLSAEANTEKYMIVKITGKADVILAKQLLKDVNYKIMEEN